MGIWSHFLKNKPHFHFSISILPVLFHSLLNLFFMFMELIRKRPVYEFFELFLLAFLYFAFIFCLLVGIVIFGQISSPAQVMHKVLFRPDVYIDP